MKAILLVGLVVFMTGISMPPRLPQSKLEGLIGGVCPDCTGLHAVDCATDGTGLPCNWTVKYCWVDAEYDPLKECFTFPFDNRDGRACLKRTRNGCKREAHEGCRLCGES